ncbi:MAG: hypothetical protein GX383_10460 [Clostridium sp.]|jgi:hypothetical protein|nr:hypothetical protein [Clostridium sp.]
MRINKYRKQGLLTKQEAAEIAGCHPNTIFNKCIKGDAECTFIDGVYYVTEEVAKQIGEDARKFKEEQKALIERREKLKRQIREAKNNQLTGGNENADKK